MNLPPTKKADQKRQEVANAAKIAQELLARQQKVRTTADSPPMFATVHSKSSWDGSPDGVATTKTTAKIQEMLRVQRAKDLAAGRIKKKPKDPLFY